MEPGVEPLPVRPKTTNVRMGRQTPQEVSHEQVEVQPQPQAEVVQRPKTTQVFGLKGRDKLNIGKK